MTMNAMQARRTLFGGHYQMGSSTHRDQVDELDSEAFEVGIEDGQEWTEYRDGWDAEHVDYALGEITSGTAGRQ